MKAARILLSLLAVGCGLLGRPAGLFAQDKDKQPEGAKPEKVRFVTADGVELHGSYFASSKKKAPVALLLHAVGEDSRKKNWVSLAEEVQKAGLNVLSFDFRGHGLSVDLVDPDKFWGIEHNRALAATKAGVGKRTIDFKNFDRRYLPTLVNDIAAARAYLERNKNDDGTCSTSSIIVIGAETGATLGASWIASEWFRFKLNPPAIPGMDPVLDTRPEGKDIIGAIFLSISPKLGDRNVRIDKLIHVPGVKGNTAMVFMYGEEDAPGKKLAIVCEKYLKKEEKNRFTTAFELKGSKLTGSALLQKSLGTEERIAEYLAELVDAKSNEWVEREFRKSQYFWKIPGGPNNPEAIILMKPVGENNLAFDTYDKFVP
jgi:hypothetical protein